MTMDKWQPERPCPIPGHPQDGADRPRQVTETAWQRLRAWHLHAPAERLPLPLVLLTWPAAWVLHAAHVPGHIAAYAAAGAVVLAWLRWRRHRKKSPHPRLAPFEAAAVAAVIGGGGGPPRVARAAGRRARPRAPRLPPRVARAARGTRLAPGGAAR